MRWKIACINWGKDRSAPRFISYVSVPTGHGDQARATEYHFTFAEAIARVYAHAPRVAALAAKGWVLRG